MLKLVSVLLLATACVAVDEVVKGYGRADDCHKVTDYRLPYVKCCRLTHLNPT